MLAILLCCTVAGAGVSGTLAVKDGVVFHQLYRGETTEQQFYQKISDTLTLLTTGGERA